MSRHLASLVYRRKIGSMMKKAVIAYMAERANDDGTGIWASKQTIANEIEASRQGVITAVKALINDGLLIEVGKRPCSTGYTFEYAIDTAKLETLDFTRPDLDGTRKNVDGSKSGPVNEADADPSTSLTGPVNQVDTNRPEPSLEPSNKDRPSSSDEFENAYQLYRSSPLKANQTKKRAKAQWPKAVKLAGSAERIVRAIEIEVDRRRKAKLGRRFMESLPDMHRWLRDERWLDVEESAVAAAPAKVSLEEWCARCRLWAKRSVWPAEYGKSPDVLINSIPSEALQAALDLLDSSDARTLTIRQTLASRKRADAQWPEKTGLFALTQEDVA